MSKTFRYDTDLDFPPSPQKSTELILPALGIWIGRPLLSAALANVLGKVADDFNVPLHAEDASGARYIPPTFSVSEDVGSHIDSDTTAAEIKRLALERAPDTYPMLKNIDEPIGGLDVLSAVFDHRAGKGLADGTYSPGDLQLRIAGKMIRRLRNEKYFLKKALGTPLSTHDRTSINHDWFHLNIGRVPNDMRQQEREELLNALNEQLSTVSTVRLEAVRPLHVVSSENPGI